MEWASGETSHAYPRRRKKAMLFGRIRVSSAYASYDAASDATATRTRDRRGNPEIGGGTGGGPRASNRRTCGSARRQTQCQNRTEAGEALGFSSSHRENCALQATRGPGERKDWLDGGLRTGTLG